MPCTELMTEDTAVDLEKEIAKKKKREFCGHGWGHNSFERVFVHHVGGPEFEPQHDRGSRMLALSSQHSEGGGRKIKIRVQGQPELLETSQRNMVSVGV